MTDFVPHRGNRTIESVVSTQGIRIIRQRQLEFGGNSNCRSRRILDLQRRVFASYLFGLAADWDICRWERNTMAAGKTRGSAGVRNVRFNRPPRQRKWTSITGMPKYGQPMAKTVWSFESVTYILTNKTRRGAYSLRAEDQCFSHWVCGQGPLTEFIGGSKRWRGRSTFIQRRAFGLSYGMSAKSDMSRRCPELLVHPFEKVAREFVTTHWSAVLAARANWTSESAEALEKLCGAYWYPLYAYVRRQGYSPDDAQDLTQGFFARVLEKDYLASADPAKGKFRSFLLTVLQRFLADERDKARALKRGGGQRLVSLDAQVAEERYQAEPSHELTPEALFDRKWAMTLLETARRRLRLEYAAAGKAGLFEQLRSFHSGDESTLAYAEAAARLAVPENTVKSDVRRLRQRYRKLVREEIAQTINSEAAIEEEIRCLLKAVGAA